MQSLNSLLRNIHLLYVKKRSYAIRKQMNSHVLVEYMQGSSIRQLAKNYNFPPSLLARGIVENITIYEKKEITKAMRDPLAKLCSVDVILEKYRDSENANVVNTNTNDGEIPSVLVSPIVDPFSGRPMPGSDTCTRLAREVLEAINSDPLYGPRVDKERNYVGIEYEMKLERALRTMSKSKLDCIPFYICLFTMNVLNISNVSIQTLTHTVIDNIRYSIRDGRAITIERYPAYSRYTVFMPSSYQSTEANIAIFGGIGRKCNYKLKR